MNEKVIYEIVRHYLQDNAVAERQNNTVKNELSYPEKR